MSMTGMISTVEIRTISSVNLNLCDGITFINWVYFKSNPDEFLLGVLQLKQRLDKIGISQLLNNNRMTCN